MPDTVTWSDAETAFGGRKYVAVDGLRTAYYRMGSGSPVILVHGGGAGADSYGNWRDSLAAFAARFDTIAVDMVGFGASAQPAPTDYPYDQDGRDRHLIGFIEALGLSSVGLVGNSMGGLTGIGAAVARPDLVNRLVLMGSAAIRTDIGPSLKAIMNYDFTLDGMRRIVQALANENYAIDEGLISYRHALTADPANKAAYQAIQGWIRDRGGLYCDEAHVAAVSVPTMVVAGKQDKVVPLGSAFRILELIPNAWGVVFPDCGHWAMMEYPDAFASVAMTFLETGRPS